MKRLMALMVIASFSIIFNYSYGQEGSAAKMPIDKDTGLITYQEVVQEAGSADDLYIRCNEWINVNYKNPSDVCRVRNRESGVIEILHRIELINMEGDSKLVAGIVNYLLKLEFKTGRYRYTISDLTLRQTSRFPIERWFDKTDKMYSPLWDSYLVQVDAKVIELIESLKIGMAPVVVAPEEKW